MHLHGGNMTDNFYDPEKIFNPFFGTMEVNFEQWITTGIDNGWISRPVCSTHDGIPTTHDEDVEWEEGGDPCIYAVRLFADDEERKAVEDNCGV
jgi:hypothetical protein